MSTKIEKLKPIKFNRKIGNDFASTLKKRVKSYFKENNKSKYGGWRMWVKLVAMLSLFFVPYGIMISGKVTNIWMLLGLFIIMGFGIAGIGMGVMHDANHGSFSKNDTVNKIIGRVIGLVGGFRATWIIQHNILHHTYTNIYGYDEDVSPAVSLLRFSPDDKRNGAHKFQHIYAWFFYGLMTVMWMTTKDFQQIARYKKMGLSQTQNTKYWKLIFELVLFKILFYAYMVVLPIIVLGSVGISWWVVLLLIFAMHFVAGLTLGAVFQTAHVVPVTNYPQPDKDLNIENNWMIHQLETTADFAPKSRIMAWFVGGLNYQVEHHLFPNISHIHYRALSKIVKETAQEFKVPYYVNNTFFSGLVAHKNMLKKLGKS
jgi:linoleoyl-CoA desaturase